MAKPASLSQPIITLGLRFYVSSRTLCPGDADGPSEKGDDMATAARVRLISFDLLSF